MDIASVAFGVVTIIVIFILLGKPLPKFLFIIFGIVGIMIAVMGVTSATMGKFLGIASVVLGIIIAISAFTKAGRRSSSSSSSSSKSITTKSSSSNSYSSSSTKSISSSSSSSSYDYDDDYDNSSDYDDSSYDDDDYDDYDDSSYDEDDYDDDDDYGSSSSYEEEDEYPMGVSSAVGVFHVYYGLASGTVYHDSDYVSDGTIYVSFKIVDVTYNINLTEDEVRGLVEKAQEEICDRVQDQYPTYGVAAKCVDFRM